MTDIPQITEQERRLLDDLEQIPDRARDEKFAAELYRALANNVWHSDRLPGKRLSVSWQRAEWLVNEWRRHHGAEPLDLAQTGGEGELDRTVAEELGRFGWSATPLHTDRHDPDHLDDPASPPPPRHGERMAPAPPAEERFRTAHEAASAERERKAGA
jgi:hypothetical protein